MVASNSGSTERGRAVGGARSEEPRTERQGRGASVTGRPASNGTVRGTSQAFGRLGCPVRGRDRGGSSSKTTSRGREGYITEDMKPSEVCDAITQVLPDSDLPGIVGHLLAIMPKQVKRERHRCTGYAFTCT